MKKVSGDDFLFFKSQCNYWISVLGIMSWSVTYKFENIGDSCAACATNYAGRCATIRLNKSINYEFNNDDINRWALHEALELLLSVLLVLAQSRVWSSEEYKKEHHMVIRTLEKLLIKEAKNGNKKSN